MKWVEKNTGWAETGFYSEDGKTFLSCGSGLPWRHCPCNGCRWEYGDPEMSKYENLDEAVKDRSEESS